jgi:hypothetical protein
MTKALFFLVALAIVGLIITGAIRLQRSNDTITIEIDKGRVAQDARAVVTKGKQVLQKAEASLDRAPSQRQ